MHNKKQYIWRLVNKIVRILGPLAIIMSLLPNIVFADVTQNVVTGSRAFNTAYQNTTGYPLFVVVSAYAVGVPASITGYSDSSASPTIVVSDCTANVSFDCVMNIVVPNNYYYKVTNAGGGLSYWTEWAMASTSSGSVSTSTSSVDNPNLDLFLGFATFFIVLYFIIWFFKKH